jgi:hypothetical protein
MSHIDHEAVVADHAAGDLVSTAADADKRPELESDVPSSCNRLPPVQAEPVRSESRGLHDHDDGVTLSVGWTL